MPEVDGFFGFLAKTVGFHALKMDGKPAGKIFFPLRRRGAGNFLLAALETVLRIDYLQRNYKKKKDALSVACKDIYKEKHRNL